MAGSDDLDDDGERATFPWLATVRSLVTALVGVLVVVVVVMVIVVVHHPEDIRISIDQGYVQSYQPWWLAVTTTTRTPILPPDEVSIIDDPTIQAPATTTPGISSVSAASLSSGPYSRGFPGISDDRPLGFGSRPLGFGSRPRVTTTYTAAPPPVSLRVTWRTYNPSESGDLMCNVTSIAVVDMSPSSTTGRVIGSIASRDKPLNFSVEPHGWHTETQWVTINDRSTMQYIFDQYEEKTSFRATVQVNATVFFKARSLDPTKDNSRSISHYCWPVTVGYGTRDDTAAFGGRVSFCETREVFTKGKIKKT